MPISLDELRLYVRCPLAWFWERRAGVARPPAVADLYPASLRQALAFLYEGHADTLPGAYLLVWRDWCQGWGAAGLLNDLARYAQGRARILELFAAGQIQRPGGGQYTAPQLTREYRQRLHAAGLLSVGQQLDEAARRQSLSMPEQDRVAGSVFGDVFADGLAAAERMGPAMPAREVVLGWQVPWRVALAENLAVAGRADLAVRAAPEAGAGAVLLEVHDFQPQPWVRAGLAGRDLGVIAAALAEPADEAGVGWERVERVIYRHWPSGETFTFRETNTGHLLAVVAAAARGLRGCVILPRALAGFEDCRACAHRERCWDERGWEALPLVDADALGQAERIRAAVAQARGALAGDDRALGRARQALAALETALAETPDLGTARALVREARQALIPSGGPR